ncbi:MAG: hypothetical protein V4564_01795 [Pseudomonadota bacterium]
MSDASTGRIGGGESAFRPLTVALMLIVGILAFVATLVLGAYAPDLRSGGTGGTHALSRAVVGFSGLYRLAEATGRHPRIIRDDSDFETEDLVILSPPDGKTNVSVPIQGRTDKQTLMILPKWDIQADPDVTGWVRYVGLFPRGVPEGVLAPGNELTVSRHPSGGAPLIVPDTMIDAQTNAPARFTAPRPLQTIAGANLRPVITDGAGRIVLGQIGTSLYVLADPDLLSNRGMKDANQAQAALALLDYVSDTDADGIAFDVTLNGLGHSPSPLKLIFAPPFLAMTLAIAAVLLLAGLYAFGRFGPPQRRPRAIAFGKAALVDNTAALVRKARREAMLGGRYVQVIRERAIAAFGVPARLRDAALDAYLDKLGGRGTFSDLARAAETADDRRALLAAAQALHDWQGEKNG